jgi:hypothetical protein
MLPVLEALSKMDVALWRDAKNGETNMPLTPQSFENMKRSTAETRDDYDRIVTKFVREREFALLSVYGITPERIQEGLYIGRTRREE